LLTFFSNLIRLSLVSLVFSVENLYWHLLSALLCSFYLVVLTWNITLWLSCILWRPGSLKLGSRIRKTQKLNTLQPVTGEECSCHYAMCSFPQKISGGLFVTGSHLSKRLRQKWFADLNQSAKRICDVLFHANTLLHTLTVFYCPT
jgi:hypothetical protein